MPSMVSLADYAGVQGFGISTPAEVAELNKALNTGAYAQANGVAAQVNGAALQVESLEESLKVLTYSDQHVKLWKQISKSPAYSTVEEYNQLLSYGSNTGGFVPEGVLPEEDDSEYRRKATFVKFLGTTRSVTHPMTLVRSAHGDVIARENQNGILWLLKQMEHALFWGDSSLAAPGREGLQFDGLNKMIDPENTIDMAGGDLTDASINAGAQMLLENYATPTTLFMPFETLATFSQAYFPKERVIMPTQGAGYQAGLVVNKFQTHGGAVSFEPDLFLQKTKPLAFTSTNGAKAPTAPGSVTAAAGTETDAQFGKELATDATAAVYKYAVTACNRFGESTPTEVASAFSLAKANFAKGVKLTIVNNASMTAAPEWFTVYRSEDGGTKLYAIARIPAGSIEASGETTWTDKNETLPNTYTAFMGEMSPQILEFKQLAPILKMDLALLGPAYRWMILLYGTPVLYAPKKWMRFTNIRATSSDKAAGLYY